ncbi:LamB/YcsF family protein [Bacillus sp. DX4.1]|uniref:LamB/YcsF family protein n=1 Tax=Bacillus sp. DX4.1 TaxID=3055867 RepID=UPI0025A122E5|nr:LamB/YcsF family protein [Bacillus sp. DX4.1]MDM5186072.1 LamB/YcsF family protein [Bacillus sp. DX4.1]
MPHPNFLSVKKLCNRTERNVKAVGGKIININVQTICIHGDDERAVQFSERIHPSVVWDYCVNLDSIRNLYAPSRTSHICTRT